jgi:thiamine monophosphate synthase
MMTPSLWIITDEASSQGRGILVVLARALAVPPPVPVVVMVRAKTLSPSAYEALALATAQLCRRAQVSLLLHNHPALVAVVGAMGCHLSSDASPARRRLARLQMPPRSWLSMSVHDGDEAPSDVDGVLWGPVHAPLSKPLHGRSLTTQAPALPTWLVGGMTPPTWLASPHRSHAAGVATIGSVMSAAHPAHALQQWATAMSS